MDIWSAQRAGRHTQGTAFGEGAVARVLSGYRYQGLVVRLLTLQRLLLVQSQPFFGSAGQLRNGDRVFVCSNPSCTAGAKRVLKVSSNATQVCCGQPMDRAMYRAAEDPDYWERSSGRRTLMYSSASVASAPSNTPISSSTRRIWTLG